MNGTSARTRGLLGFKTRTAVLVLATAAIGLGAGAPTVMAASFDPRIQGEHQIECLGSTYGLSPSVRIKQPWVLGTGPAQEAIGWMPWLERYERNPSTGTSGWVSKFRSTDFYWFWATNQGPNFYWYTYQPRQHLFESLQRGYYYRVVHVVKWSSTGQLGMMPSDYHSTSGYCLL